MTRPSRIDRKWFPILALTLALGAVPVRPSDSAELPMSPPERKVLDEYRLYCKPGPYFEDVRANLDFMQKAGIRAPPS